MSGQFYQPGAGMRYRTAAYPANPYVPTSPNGNFGAGSGRGGVLPGGYSNDKVKRPSAARRLKAIGIALLVCLIPVLLFFASAMLQAYRTQRAPDHPSEELYETKSGKQKFGSIFNQPDVFLSVVVPAYNEEKRMKDGVSEMLDYLTKAESANADFSWELILVDDGSRDATYQTAMDQFVLSASSPPEGRVRVLKSWSNGGKGAAVRKGVLRARGRYILMADADGATAFADVEALLEALTGHRGPPPVPVTSGAIPPNRPGGRGVESGPRQPWRDKARSPFARKGARRQPPPAQGKGRALLETAEQPVGTAAAAAVPRGVALHGRGVALGSRSVRGSGSSEASVSRSALRRVAQWGFHTALRLLLGAGGEVQDTQCGFKLFTRLAAAELFTSLHIERWAFDVELVYLAATRLAIPLTEVPVAWHEVAGSKLDVKSASVQMLRDIVVIRACYSLGIWSAAPSAVRGVPVPGLDPGLASDITGAPEVIPSVAELLASMAQQEAAYARQRAYVRKWAAAKGAYQGGGMEGQGGGGGAQEEEGEGGRQEGEGAEQGPEDSNVPPSSTVSPTEGDAGDASVAPAPEETLPLSPLSSPAVASPPLQAIPLAEGEEGGSDSSSTAPSEPHEGDIVIVESGEGGGGEGGGEAAGTGTE